MQGTEEAQEPALGDGADLVEQDDRIRFQAPLRSFDEHLRRVEVGIVLRHDGRGHGEIAEAIPEVVLGDDGRPRFGSLHTFGRVEANHVDVAPFRTGYRRRSRCQTSSDNGSHSAAISRSR